MKQIFYILIFGSLLFGCNSYKKATKHLIKATAGNKPAVAAWCGKLFPPVTLVKDSMVYKSGAVQGRVYVYADCDSFKNIQYGKIKIPCPTVVQVDTIVLYKEKHIVNQAKVEKLEADLMLCNSELFRVNKMNSFLKKVCVGLSICVLLFVIVKLYKGFF